MWVVCIGIDRSRVAGQEREATQQAPDPPPTARSQRDALYLADGCVALGGFLSGRCRTGARTGRGRLTQSHRAITLRDIWLFPRTASTAAGGANAAALTENVAPATAAADSVRLIDSVTEAAGFSDTALRTMLPLPALLPQLAPADALQVHAPLLRGVGNPPLDFGNQSRT